MLFYGVRWRKSALALFSMVLSGCASIDIEPQRPNSLALADASATTLGRAFARDAAAHAGQSGIQVLATGHEALVARGALTDLAERTLDLQYYSVGDDESSRLLLERLVAAAGRGVRVRILLDDLFGTAREFGARAVAAHPNVQVRLFNPFRAIGGSTLARLPELLVDAERLNVRMHNKAWIADNAVAVFGSRNIGDEYFDLNEDEGFTDIDLLVIGASVRAMSDAFDAYWNSGRAVPVERLTRVDRRAPQAQDLTDLRAGAERCDASTACRWLAETELRDALSAGSLRLTWAPTRFVADPSEDEKAGIRSGIEHGYVGDDPRGGRTRDELLIVSPYFIPGEHGVQHLAQMRASGRRVAVLTNSLASTDSVAAHAGYARRRVGLLRAGVQLYEFQPKAGVEHRRRHRWGQASPVSLHTKLVVQDRSRAIVGSFNQDPRSRLHNTESWLVIDSVEISAQLAGYFEEAIEPDHSFRPDLHSHDGLETLVWYVSERGVVVRSETEPMADAWLRAWRSVLGALIPEHLL